MTETQAAAEPGRPDSFGDEPVVRRAPFAANPAVGARGKKAQRKILMAALDVFGELGYDQCKVGRITAAAGCSRVSFYQYFSSKEDVFRQLSTLVYEELVEVAAGVGGITPDGDGHRALQAWFTRYGQVYDAYEPVYTAFHTATIQDADLQRGARRATARVLTALDSHISGSSLPGERRRAVVRLISEMAIRGNRYRAVIASGSPPVPLGHERLDAALTDAAHRALFGLLPGVNDVAAAGVRLFEDEPGAWPSVEPSHSGSRVRSAVLDASRAVFLERGYYATRIDHIAERADVSHGAMYRYFRTKGELFRVLGSQAAERFNQAFDELAEVRLAEPDVSERFRRWIHEYAKSCAEAAGIMGVWAEALARNPELGADSAAAIRFASNRLAGLLAQRGYGDPDAEALVLLAELDAIITIGHTVEQVEVGAATIERSFLATR